MGIETTVERLGQALTRRGWMLATAESCTGGLIGHTLTDLAGSSAWYAGGVVAYANEVKRDVLGVPRATLDGVGAVSRETVAAMAAGVARLLRAQAAVAVSGVAGPGGGTPEKPVGTVWMAWSVDGVVTARRFAFTGDRARIKAQTACAALEELAALLG